jgi:hypothetical protein
MNKLLKPALMAFTAVLTTVLISCSGSDGKNAGDGPSGEWPLNCSAEPEGEGVVVKCNGTTIGTLTPGAKGPDGDPGGHGPVCTAEPAGGGSYLVTCEGSPSITITGAADGSNCLLKDSLDILTINCGKGNFRLSLCGSGSTGWYSANSNGTPKRSTFNENTHFCSKDYALDVDGKPKVAWSNKNCKTEDVDPTKNGEDCNEVLLPRCGAAAVVGGIAGEAYDPSVKYCARSLVAEVTRVKKDGKRIDSDLIEEAGLLDVDADRPWSANWKALYLADGDVLKQCFVAPNDVRACDSDDATVSNFKATGALSQYKAALKVSGAEFAAIEAASPVSGIAVNAVTFCDPGYFYNLDAKKCTIVETDEENEEDGQCRALLAGSNACHSDENPSSASNSALLAKSCFPMLSAPGGATDSDRSPLKLWYDPSTVGSCNPVRRTLPSAIVCNSSASRQVSTWQAMDAEIYTIRAASHDADSIRFVNWIGLNLPEGAGAIDEWKSSTGTSAGSAFPGFTGLGYDKKVSCYESKAATDCNAAVTDYFRNYNLSATSALVAPSAGSVVYISSTSDSRFGFCALASSAASACPGPSTGTDNKYNFNSAKKQVYDACYNWALNTNEATKIGTTSGVTLKTIAEAFALTETGKSILGGVSAKEKFARAFGYACSNGESEGTQNNLTGGAQLWAQGSLYACESGGKTIVAPALLNTAAEASSASKGFWALDNDNIVTVEWDATSSSSTVTSALWMDATTTGALIEVCNQFESYYTNLNQYCILDIASASGTCFPGSSQGTDKNQCVLTAANRIVPAPKSGFNNIDYKANTTVTEYTATPNSLMCPHNGYDSKSGFCVVDGNLKKPECFTGYKPNPGYTRCEYGPDTPDCPFGHVWHPTRKRCEKSTAEGINVVGAICPHDMTNGGVRSYISTGSSDPRAADHGLCIEAITRKHCPSGTTIIEPIQRLDPGLSSTSEGQAQLAAALILTVDNPRTCDYTTSGSEFNSSSSVLEPKVLLGLTDAQNLYPAPKPECLKGDTLGLTFDMKDAGGTIGYVCMVPMTPSANSNGNKLCKLNTPAATKEFLSSNSGFAATYDWSSSSAGVPAIPGSCRLAYNADTRTGVGAAQCPSGGKFASMFNSTSGTGRITNVWPRCEIDLSDVGTEAGLYCPVRLMSVFKTECRITACAGESSLVGKTFDPTRFGYATDAECVTNGVANANAAKVEEDGDIVAACGSNVGDLVIETAVNYTSCAIAKAYSAPACETGTTRNPFNKRCEKL